MSKFDQFFNNKMALLVEGVLGKRKRAEYEYIVRKSRAHYNDVIDKLNMMKEKGEVTDEEGWELEWRRNHDILQVVSHAISLLYELGTKDGMYRGLKLEELENYITYLEDPEKYGAFKWGETSYGRLGDYSGASAVRLKKWNDYHGRRMKKMEERYGTRYPTAMDRRIYREKMKGE